MKVEWFLNDYLLEEDEEFVIETTTNSSRLMLSKVRTDVPEIYECLFSNELGSIKAVLNLSLLETKRNKEKGALLMKEIENDDIDVTTVKKMQAPFENEPSTISTLNEESDFKFLDGSPESNTSTFIDNREFEGKAVQNNFKI